jgi:SAM-dependent methyltransferase
MSASPTERLLPGLAALHEGLGSAYERYAVGRLTERLVQELGVRSVAEWPANGVLGVPGLKSLPLALLGCDVTLVSPSAELLDGARTVWRAVGAEPKVVVASPEDEDAAPARSFDLVWSFCAFEHARDPGRLARAMVRASKGHVLVFVQNAWMPGVHLHRFQHAVDGRPWDHGTVSSMRAETVASELRAAGADVVALGGCDLPPWPDINVRLPRREPRDVSRRGAPRPYGPGDAVVSPDDAARILTDTPALTPAMRALAAWHDRVERSLPSGLLRFIAHHPYVLAKTA